MLPHVLQTCRLGVNCPPASLLAGVAAQRVQAQPGAKTAAAQQRQQQRPSAVAAAAGAVGVAAATGVSAVLHPGKVEMNWMPAREVQQLLSLPYCTHLPCSPV
jgi:hypothetical protein